MKRQGSSRFWRAYRALPKEVQELKNDDGWFPRYRGARLVFWSNGGARTWSAVMPEQRSIEDFVFVPAYGLVILRAR